MEKTKIAVSPAVQVGGSLFTPEQLALVGTLAGQGASIEMTPFKQLYVEVPSERLEAVRTELQRVGLQVLPAGFVTKGLIACNFCKGAEEAGLEIARSLDRAIAGIDTPTPLKIGYAGCALGTSEPLLKDIGVVKMREKFDLYVGGDPKGLKATTGRLLASGIDPERLAPAVRAIVDFYRSHAKGKEKFAKFIDRMTLERMRALVS